MESLAEEHGSNNWQKQRQTVAHRYASIKRKRRNVLYELSNYYVQEYDIVAVEDLGAKGSMGESDDSRSRASAAWATSERFLEYEHRRGGAHFVAVKPAGTDISVCARPGERQPRRRRWGQTTAGAMSTRTQIEP